jgi:hypothetical protein
LGGNGRKEQKTRESLGIVALSGKWRGEDGETENHAYAIAL